MKNTMNLTSASLLVWKLLSNDRPTLAGPLSSKDDLQKHGETSLHSITASINLTNHTIQLYGCKRPLTKSGNSTSQFGIAEMVNYMDMISMNRNVLPSK